MTIHDQLKAILDNKKLYSEEEYYQLLNEWKKDYQQYLVNKVKY